ELGGPPKRRWKTQKAGRDRTNRQRHQRKRHRLRRFVRAVPRTMAMTMRIVIMCIVGVRIVRVGGAMRELVLRSVRLPVRERIACMRRTMDWGGTHGAWLRVLPRRSPIVAEERHRHQPEHVE